MTELTRCNRYEYCGKTSP